AGAVQNLRDAAYCASERHDLLCSFYGARWFTGGRLQRGERLMRETASQVHQTEVMNWTILPATVTARAWTDKAFRLELLSDPTPLLRQSFKSCPLDTDFRVVENRGSTRHLVLPYRHPSRVALS